MATEDPRATLQACLAGLAENKPADAVLQRLRGLEQALRDDPLARARLLRARAIATNRLGFAGEALGDLHEARRLLEGSEHNDELAEVFRAIATVFSWRGESREAALALLRVVAEASVTDDRTTLALALIEGGRLQMEIGRPADAQALFARGFAAGAALPARERQRAWVNLLQATVAAGHMKTAATQLAGKDDALSGASARLLLLTELEAARCAAAAGDLAAAGAALGRAALHAPESTEAFERIEIAEAQAEFALSRGDAATAAALLAPVIARYADDDLATREVRARLVQAKALHALGHTDEAERTLAAALRRALARSLSGYADEVRSRLMADFGGIARLSDAPLAAEIDPSTRFVRQRPLGSGAFGKVLRAYDLELGIEVAIKRAARGDNYDPALREQLLEAARTEVSATARIDHPGIARVFGVLAVQGGDTLVVEEFIEGRTLRHAMESGLDRAQSLALLSRIAFALAAVHGAGVIHRDLKPDNVILRGDAPVLIDFGVALLAGTRHHAGVGTPAYMAPEQMRGSAVDVRADLYALGVIAHEMLTGKRPEAIHSRTPFAAFLQARRIRNALAGAGIAPEIAALIARLLAPSPRMRPASAAEVGTIFAKASEAARGQ
jgi:tRNA A-37 threonylcarbamoyl transferase component Bud32